TLSGGDFQKLSFSRRARSINRSVLKVREDLSIRSPTPKKQFFEVTSSFSRRARSINRSVLKVREDSQIRSRAPKKQFFEVTIK
ncbi:MAG: hypothetical protein RR872_07060, partial [Mucinivorans sp.]